MKTQTVALPVDLIDRLKAEAHQRRLSLVKFTELALRGVLMAPEEVLAAAVAHWSENGRGSRQKAAKRRKKGVRRGS